MCTEWFGFRSRHGDLVNGKIYKKAKWGKSYDEQTCALSDREKKSDLHAVGFVIKKEKY